MHASAYVEAFSARGVMLWREGEALRYKAPRGVLTPSVLEKLRQAKPKILPVLPELAQVGAGEGGVPERTGTDNHGENQTLSPDLTHWQEGGIFHATTQDRLASAWGAAHAFHKPLAGVVWHKDKGVKVEDIARWLQLRDEQIKGLSEGDDAPLWTETKLGARIAADLCEFALWWASGEAWADPPGVGSL